MPIDDYTGDKPDSPANAATTPGKYIKITVLDFSDTPSNTNPTTMAPTPLCSYLRLGAVEDVAKAGKASTSGPVGLVTDLYGNPLKADLNAPYNPAYDPYAPFGPTNLPKDGQGALPPLSTPTAEMPVLPNGAPAYLAAPGPDPTGEDLASLVQGFADDTRNRGPVQMTLQGSESGNYTPGGQPDDSTYTTQGPMYGYPWVTPVPGPKAPGTLDAKNVSKTEDAAFTAASKPPFFPDDYRALESSQLHTKGGWRDHTDGNRITTTRGDKIEVIRGNYKLIVLGRQDQTKPKYAGMDISGGQATTTSGDLTADASTDFNQGSTAYASLFEWRQCTTKKRFDEAVAAASNDGTFNAWKGQAEQDLATAQKAQADLDALTYKVQALADPLGCLAAMIAAAQRAVVLSTTPAQSTKSAAALAAAKKTLLTLEQAIDPNLLEGTAMVALAATALPGTSGVDAVQCWNAAAAQTTATATATWGAPAKPTSTPPAISVSDALTLAKLLDVQAQGSTKWEDAWTAYAAWAGIPSGVETAQAKAQAAQYAADTANAANAATAAAAAEAAAAQAAAAQTAADTAAAADANADVAHFGADAAAAAAAAQAASAAQAAADAAAQAKTDAAEVATAPLATAAKSALAMWTQPVAAVVAATAAAKSAKAAAAADAALAADPTNTAKQQAAQQADQQASADAKTAAQAALPPTLTTSTQAANAANAAQLVWNLAQQTPPGLNLTDAAAQAWAQAAYSAGMAQAAAMAAGLFSSPLDTLQLWEDGDKSPPDYRSYATTKKGSGPKVQVKYQRGGKDDCYRQDRGKHSPDVPGDGVTYATPISMGVLINETWSHQIYNYSGIGYYPATAPQPWPPAPPKGQFQPIGNTPLAGSALPAEPPKRDKDKDALAPWSQVPQWVIYPVSKIVNKSYVVHQSSEVFADRTVSITAGLRPFPRDAPSTKHPVAGFDPRDPYRTYPTDVPQWVDAAGTPRSSYKDTLHDTHDLPSKATYDWDLLTDSDMKFPSKVTLEAWILNPDPTKEVATIRDYKKVEQTWTETHVEHQATFVRAGTVLSDTKVVNDQYTNVVVGGGSNSNTTVTGNLHTMLHTFNTTVDTTVIQDQCTTVHARGIESHTVAGSTTSTAAIAGPVLSFTAAVAAVTLKAAVLDLQVLLAAHAGINVGPTAKVQLGPVTSAQIGPRVSTSVPQDVAMHIMRTLLAGATIDDRTGVGIVTLAPLHSIG